MIIVVSCSGSKTIKSSDQNLIFCANPDLAPSDGKKYVHPDSKIEPSMVQTWRDWINSHQESLILKEAYSLYENDIYGCLFSTYGEQLYIFSAGWGIVKASFKLPYYDITFSRGNNIKRHAIRNNKCLPFNDYNQMSTIDKNDEILFIGGANYILPFCELTKNIPNTKRVIFKSKLNSSYNKFSNRPDFHFEEYQAIEKGFTNWHYVYVRRELL